MNKNYLIIAISLLVVGLAIAGVIVYNHQTSLDLQKQQLELDKQKEQTKVDTANKEADLEAGRRLSNTLNRSTCISDADKKRDNTLSINSDYETKDENGGTVYHGNATVFSGIESTYQQEVSRCNSLYQN